MNGIIVGSDITQEWILPWWWDNYSQHNSFPVVFIDFGMSFEMKEWCKARGELIQLRILDFAIEREDLKPDFVEKLENKFGAQFWDCRGAWFKKPFACLQTPFQRTLWIDLDCEIKGSITPLFEFANSAIGMATDWDEPIVPHPIYNSGVIAFDRSHLSLFELWSQWCIEKNHLFRGDQEVLSHLIYEKNIKINPIPHEYNWSRCRESHPQAIIHHWHGVLGKWVIKNQMQQKEPF